MVGFLGLQKAEVLGFTPPALDAKYTMYFMYLISFFMPPKYK